MQFRGNSEAMKASETVFSLLQALGNPEESKRFVTEIMEKIKDLEAATAKYEDRIKKVGKVEDIDRLHAETVADRDMAATEIANVKPRAAQIIADAMKKADEIDDAIKKRNAKSLARERRIAEAESAVARREEAAASAKDKADARMAEAVAIKGQYKELYDRMTAALKAT